VFLDNELLLFDPRQKAIGAVTVFLQFLAQPEFARHILCLEGGNGPALE
jgi:hypothetical protein